MFFLLTRPVALGFRGSVGVDKLEALLAPLVERGLASVLLFGVPVTCTKVGRRPCALARPPLSPPAF